MLILERLYGASNKPTSAQLLSVAVLSQEKETIVNANKIKCVYPLLDCCCESLSHFLKTIYRWQGTHSWQEFF